MPDRIKILLVEDNPADARLFLEALKSSKIPYHLHTVTDGEECLSYISKIGKSKECLSPDIMVLDLNLPKKDGKMILKELKSHDSFKSMPIIVLTSSQSQEDINTCYNLHANSYIVKAMEFSQFENILKSIENYWFNIVKLPKKDN